ncbi:multiple cyclophane-containing RiPP AmcA [Micromonospora echinospora]
MRDEESPSAYRREGCVGGWAAVCSQPSSRCGGLAPSGAGPPSRGTRHRGGADVTLYISRSVATSQPQRIGLPALALAAPVAVADPPLLTHVWRRFFEQPARQEVRR